MNFMSNANNGESGVPGSLPTDPVSQTPAGESGQQGQGFDYEAAYKELESKFGAQGQELGEYRTFVNQITPLLEKLDANPDLVRAIVDGKIDESLVKAVLEGKVSQEDAQVVTQASQQVANEVGNKNMSNMTPDQIEALINAKANEIRQEMEQKAELQSFEQRTQAFIESTPDFVEYAEEIDKWLDTHNIADIEVAYYAVKGQMSSSQAQKAAEEAAAERQKEMILNAGGGTGFATTAPDGTPLIDKLVGGPANPLF
jgi:hypothetical protein